MDCDKSSYKLLVVDDNEMNRDLMSLQLRHQGYKIVTAESGTAALKALSDQTFDIVLLDVMMPGMNGIEVLHEIRKSHSLLNLPVIMVTADDQQERILEALQSGANDYLIKPLNIPVTIARIKTQLTLKDLAALKDEFVRFASHDLKKPLIVSLDIIEALKQSFKPGEVLPDEAPELLDLLEKTGQNMQDVIAGFLNTEALETGQSGLHFKPIPLNQIVTKSLQANQEYATKKGVTLVVDLEPDLPLVDADEFRLTQVLDNLIGNAMKFSPQKTTTVVRTRSDGEYVYAEVSDGGPGLTAEDMDKLFVKNARLSNQPTGDETSTGVGLSISKQLVDQHHGRIGAHNNAARGATFWFGVPIRHQS